MMPEGGTDLRTADSLLAEMRDVEDRAAGTAHAKKIADAMAPDPKEWSYEGDCADGGGGGLDQPRCTCGHPIRWIYTIIRARDGKTLPIGSTCIESTVPYLMECGAEGLATALQAAVERTRELIAEAERRKRDAANDDRVVVLAAERARLAAWLRNADKLESAKRWNQPRRWLPNGCKPFLSHRQPAALSTPGRTAAALARSVGTALASLLASGDWPDAPMPESPEVRTACRKELLRKAASVREYARYQADPAASAREAEAMERAANLLA